MDLSDHSAVILGDMDGVDVTTVIFADLELTISVDNLAIDVKVVGITTP